MSDTIHPQPLPRAHDNNTQRVAIKALLSQREAPP